jgi:hypothetical protein
MKNLASFSMIHQRVESLKEQQHLEKIGDAFDWFALQTVLRLNAEEIEDSITDGSNDCGIDAVYISENTIHICNCKYGYDINQTEKNFPGTEIEKIISTLSLIMSANLSRDTVNQALWDKYLEIKDYFMTSCSSNIVVHLISNKQKPVDLERHKLENAFSRFRIVQFKYYDLEDLVTLLLSSKEERIDSSLMLLDDQHFEKADGDIKTVIGVITAEDLLKMLIDRNDQNSLNESAFNDNVRLYKPRHSVNKAIIDSALSNKNYQFFYQNNGITIICEECSYVPHLRNQTVSLRNIQLVNGGQTAHSLFEAYKKDPEKVRNVDILIRICIAKKDTQIAEIISECTNNQIPVGSRDLKSNDIIQKKLQDQFELLGYYYERKNNQYHDVDISKILNNELLAQLYLAYELDCPSEAKNNKYLIFNDFYEKIFNEEQMDAQKLLNIYNVYLPLFKIKKDILGKKRKNEILSEKDAFVSRAIFHLLYSVKLILKYEKRSIQNQNDVNYAIGKSIEYMKEIIAIEMDKRKEFYTHDKFFKEISTNKIIADYIYKKYILSF